MASSFSFFIASKSFFKKSFIFIQIPFVISSIESEVNRVGFSGISKEFLFTAI
jgi:hypothetical protein